MARRTLRDASRVPYITKNDMATESEIRTGALQRIADALEDVAKDYRRARAERDRVPWTPDQNQTGAREMTGGNLSPQAPAARAGCSCGGGMSRLYDCGGSSVYRCAAKSCGRIWVDSGGRLECPHFWRRGADGFACVWCGVECSAAGEITERVMAR